MKFVASRALLSLPGLVCAGIVLLAFASLFSLGAEYHWMLDLFSHFRVHYVCCAGLGVLFLHKTHRHWALASAAVLVVNVIPLSPMVLGSPTSFGPSTTSYRAASSNVLA